MFRERGATNVRLNVDRDNVTAATHLYERAGMHLRRRWLMVAKPDRGARRFIAGVAGTLPTRPHMTHIPWT
jgi:ribosomal protein S18 acetylase RimI-like enzyme